VTAVAEPARPAATGRDVGPEEVAAVLARPETRLVVATHRDPDGDAVGSMLGLWRCLVARGRDAVMWHAQDRPVPDDLSFLLRPREEIATEPPADAGRRTLVALDCASAVRLTDGPLRRLGGTVLNLDHHHDNTRFGDLNLVEPGASSTAEVVVHVLEALGWPVTGDVAEPLYVALVTDTGRFGYSNATPEAHRVAGLLVAAGADPAALARRLYEEMPPGRARLLGRALAGVDLELGGRLAVSVLRAAELAAAGDDTEGIVEALRGIRGVAVAALLRELPEGSGYRVSLRAADERVDVSEIARQHGGGGHRAAAGVTVHRPLDEVRAWLLREVVARLGP
jgi:phosphoesterase RecJ-like protein